MTRFDLTLKWTVVVSNVLLAGFLTFATIVLWRHEHNWCNSAATAAGAVLALLAAWYARPLKELQPFEPLDKGVFLKAFEEEQKENESP